MKNPMVFTCMQSIFLSISIDLLPLFICQFLFIIYSLIFFLASFRRKMKREKKLIAVTWLNLWWSCIFRAHIFHRTVHSWWICYAILSKPLYHLKWFGNRIKSPFVTKCECECECVRRARRQQTTDNTVPYIRDDTFDMVNKLDSIMWVYWI